MQPAVHVHGQWHEHCLGGVRIALHVIKYWDGVTFQEIWAQNRSSVGVRTAPSPARQGCRSRL
jgi:hypothetical protein